MVTRILHDAGTFICPVCYRKSPHYLIRDWKVQLDIHDKSLSIYDFEPFPHCKDCLEEALVKKGYVW